MLSVAIISPSLHLGNNKIENFFVKMSSHENFDCNIKDIEKKETNYTLKTFCPESKSSIKNAKIKHQTLIWTSTASYQNKLDKSQIASKNIRMNKHDKLSKDISQLKYRSNQNEKEIVLPQSPCEWSEHISKSGRKYYFNIRTEISQWEKPQILIERESILKMRTAKMLLTMKRTLEGNNDLNSCDIPLSQPNKIIKITHETSHQNHIQRVTEKRVPTHPYTLTHNVTSSTQNVQDDVNLLPLPYGFEEATNDSPNSTVTINLQKALHNLHQAIIHSQKSKPTSNKTFSQHSSSKTTLSPSIKSLSSSSVNDFDSIGDPEETFRIPEQVNSLTEIPVSRLSFPTNQQLHLKPDDENKSQKLSATTAYLSSKSLPHYSCHTLEPGLLGSSVDEQATSEEICYGGKDIKLHLCQTDTNENDIPIYEIITNMPESSHHNMPNTFWARTTIQKDANPDKENQSIADKLFYDKTDPISSRVINDAVKTLAQHNGLRRLPYFRLYSSLLINKFLRHCDQDYNVTRENTYNKVPFDKITLIMDSENVFCKKIVKFFESSSNEYYLLPSHGHIDTNVGESNIIHDAINLTSTSNTPNFNTVEAILHWDSTELERKANSYFADNMGVFYIDFMKSDVSFNSSLMTYSLHDAMVLIYDERLNAISQHNFNLNEYKTENVSFF